jgi:hypothetical protein
LKCLKSSEIRAYKIYIMTLKSSTPSICIPRAFNNIKSKQVEEVFNNVLSGESSGKCVARVDCIKRKDDKGQQFNRFFVHFKYWPNNELAQGVREKLMNGKDIKIVYDEPWFWKCSQSRIPKPEDYKRKVKAPYLLIENENENHSADAVKANQEDGYVEESLMPNCEEAS